MKKILYSIAIICSLAYIIGCIGSYDNGTMTITALLIRAAAALSVECAGFYLIGKDEKGERDNV